MKVSATVFSLVAIALHMPLALSAVLKSDAETADSRIKNVVVLVMENRSFDSILGRLQWDGIRSDIDGLTGNESNTLANGQVVPIQRARILLQDSIQITHLFLDQLIPIVISSIVLLLHGYTNNGAFLGVPCRTIYENMADHGNSYKFYSPQLKSTPLLYAICATFTTG
ncbi:hypothetical protein BSLG_005629 [Batrachochytrium salamandrivorans]|nr:hypothetical protein BSLG_005629 [Batrachochytrium salamandrivorans]